MIGKHGISEPLKCSETGPQMSNTRYGEMYVDEKYAPPYPQEFDRFWPHHAFKAGIAVIITLALLVGLSIFFQVPTNIREF